MACPVESCNIIGHAILDVLFVFFRLFQAFIMQTTINNPQKFSTHFLNHLRIFFGHIEMFPRIRSQVI